MNHAVAFAVQVLHIAAMAAAAPTLIGVIRWLQARLTGRTGPKLLQTWRDLARLLRKQPVMAESASDVSAVAPVLSAACVAVAAVLVPSFALGMTFAPFADLPTIVGLLALARCTTALAGMDAGSALGGLGASRAMTPACLSEPVLLLVIFTLGLLAGSSNLDLVAAMRQEAGVDLHSGAGLALATTLLVVVTDGGIGPAARSELALLRGATASEFSGGDLAVIEATEALRLLVWFNLIAAMFLPVGIAPAGDGVAGLAVGLLCWLAKLVALTVAFVLLQSLIGQIRLAVLPRVLGIAIVLALLSAVFLFASVGIA